MEQIKLNLGCANKKKDGYVNIDIDPKCNPDLVLDLSKNALPFQDNSVDEVRAFDFLEHIPLGKTIFVVDEIWRALKPGGKFEHFTPSADGRGAFQDPTHLSFWNNNSWLYFCEGVWAGMYGIKSRFRPVQLYDIITSDSMRIIHTHGIFIKPEDV